MADVTVKLAAVAPLNFTAVAPVKFVPLIVTTVPAGPLVGVKLVIVGATQHREVARAGRRAARRRHAQRPGRRARRHRRLNRRVGRHREAWPRSR